MPDLLIEILSEEIPARMQARAAEDLQRLVTDGLVAAGLTYAGARAFATPRRLALAVEGLSGESPARREERKGPRTDAPQAALAGFLRSAGVAREALVKREAGKAEVWFAVIEHPGRPSADIVAEVLEAAIRGFPWPKSMRWGAGNLRWVRPIHSILCLLTTEAGAEVVPFEIDGIRAGNRSAGHRFMAPAGFAVSGFEDYATKLKRGFVILDPAERQAAILHDAEQAAFAAGLELVADPALLAEVAGLVEWPVVLMGAIGEEFALLPAEVLQASMRTHQKFFSLRNPKTGGIERFVTVANRATADNGATILAGNGKVLAARLSDARFFWDNDLRTVLSVGMEGMAKGLESVTFHNKLGSQADRVARIEALAREIAPLVGAKPDLAAEAARICKADLQSAMVGEFPELQGLMGRYYALEVPLPAEVAEACEMHYKPLGPSDEVPTSPVSVAVALADKIDTLTGFWAIDEKPTGSKDPFALRRAALGVIRLIKSNNLRLRLSWLIGLGLGESGHGREIDVRVLSPTSPIFADVYEHRDAASWDEAFLARMREQGFDPHGAPNYFRDFPDLLDFFHDRLKVHLRDEGIRHDVIDACLAMPGNDDLTLLVKRAEALAAFLKTEDGKGLLKLHKRTNIVEKEQAKDNVEYSYGFDQKFFVEDAERALFAALDAAEAAIAPAMQAEDFGAAMAAMAALRAPIDGFFESVQVNAENPILRRNRLNLLSRIRATCRTVADLSRIEG